MHSDAVLEEKLESYSNCIAANRVDGAWRRCVGHVPRYAAAVSSALALATSANANIVYSGYQNVRASLPGSGLNGSILGQINLGGARFTEDIFANNNGVGYAAVESFLAFAYGSHPQQSVGSVMLGPTRRGFGSSHPVGFARRLNSGQVISSKGNFGKTAVLRSRAFGTRGQFQPGQFGFAGIRFLAPDGFHYGWIRFGLTDSPVGNPNQVEALDWAYDTVPGEAVAAGEGFVPGVPEPDAKPLLLLAVGALGVQLWRRNRPA